MTPVVMILYFPEDHASNDEYTSEREDHYGPAIQAVSALIYSMM
jgi:hypothetical protein